MKMPPTKYAVVLSVRGVGPVAQWETADSDEAIALCGRVERVASGFGADVDVYPTPCLPPGAELEAAVAELLLTWSLILAAEERGGEVETPSGPVVLGTLAVNFAPVPPADSPSL